MLLRGAGVFEVGGTWPPPVSSVTVGVSAAAAVAVAFAALAVLVALGWTAVAVGLVVGIVVGCLVGVGLGLVGIGVGVLVGGVTLGVMLGATVGVTVVVSVGDISTGISGLCTPFCCALTPVAASALGNENSSSMKQMAAVMILVMIGLDTPGPVPIYSPSTGPLAPLTTHGVIV